MTIKIAVVLLEASRTSFQLQLFHLESGILSSYIAVALVCVAVVVSQLAVTFQHYLNFLFEIAFGQMKVVRYHSVKSDLTQKNDQDPQHVDAGEAAQEKDDTLPEAVLCGMVSSSQWHGLHSAVHSNPAVKECSVHLDKVASEDETHGRLTPGCATNHKDESEIICTSCLKQYLYSQMFPIYLEEIRHKFPSSSIKCWALKCSEVLDHHIIQKYADVGTFRMYDLALCQRYYEEDPTIAKCAFSDCTGACWIDKTECTNSKILCCPVCGRDTCVQCDRPYETHSNRPCPRRSRNPNKIRLEEIASRIKMSSKHKCPKCPLRYEKIGGCDRIICGGSYTASVTNGEFRHRCRWSSSQFHFCCASAD